MISMVCVLPWPSIINYSTSHGLVLLRSTNSVQLPQPFPPTSTPLLFCAYTGPFPAYSPSTSDICGPFSSSSPGSSSSAAPHTPPRRAPTSRGHPPPHPDPLLLLRPPVPGLHHRHQSNSPATTNTPSVIPTVNPIVNSLPIPPPSPASVYLPIGPGGAAAPLFDPDDVAVLPALVTATLIDGAPPGKRHVRDLDNRLRHARGERRYCRRDTGAPAGAEVGLQQKVAEDWPRGRRGCRR